MLRDNKNKFKVLLTCAAITSAALFAFKTPERKQEGFKNLQILPKDISHEDLDKIMHGFNNALGVKCMYCHVHEGSDFRSGWDFSKDDKEEKQIARHMLKMTMGINSTYFNFSNSTQTDTIHVVTCITCHRGIAHPDADGIADQMKKLGGGQPPMMPPPPPPGQAPPKN
jgi:hypothetical protein